MVRRSVGCRGRQRRMGLTSWRMMVKNRQSSNHGGRIEKSKMVVVALLTAFFSVAAYAIIPRVIGAAALSGTFGASPRNAGPPDIPMQINHQGVIKVNGVRFKGSGDFRFALVDPDSGNYLWTNDNSNVTPPDPPTNPVNVEVVDGIYNARLGDTSRTNMTAIPSNVFNDNNVQLRIWFDDLQGNLIQQLGPDHVLTSAPYAFRVHDGVTLSEDQTISGNKTFTGVTSFEAVAQLVADSQPGDLFVHSAIGIQPLGPGVAGQLLQSQGPGLSPIWAEANIGGLSHSGSYAGTGSAMTIQVGSTPDAVFINDNFNWSYIIIGSNSMYLNGAVQASFPSNGDLVDGGFTVGNTTTSANQPGRFYTWIAFKTNE